MRGCVYSSTQMSETGACLGAPAFDSARPSVQEHNCNDGLSWLYMSGLLWSNEIVLPMNSLGCRNLRRHSQLQTRWTHIFFFFALSISFLVARALTCSRPVGLSSCACIGILYHLFSPSTCVSQNGWPGNRVVKCADAYKFGREFIGNEFRRPQIRFPCLIWSERIDRTLWVAPDLDYGSGPLWTKRSEISSLIQDSCQRIVWDAATCCGTLNYKHDEPTSFFFFIPIEAAHLWLPRSTSSTWRRSRC